MSSFVLFTVILRLGDILEISCPVGELVVEQGAGMLVGTRAEVTDVRPLVRVLQVICRVRRRRRAGPWCSGVHGEAGAGQWRWGKTGAGEGGWRRRELIAPVYGRTWLQKKRVTLKLGKITTGDSWNSCQHFSTSDDLHAFSVNTKC